MAQFREGTKESEREVGAWFYPSILREASRITRSGRSDTQMVLLGAVGPCCSLLNSPERWQWAVRAQIRMSLGGLDGMILHLSRRTAQTDAATAKTPTKAKPSATTAIKAHEMGRVTASEQHCLDNANDKAPTRSTSIESTVAEPQPHNDHSCV